MRQRDMAARAVEGLVRPPVTLAAHVVAGAGLMFSLAACLSGETPTPVRDVNPAPASPASANATAIYEVVLGDFAKHRNLRHIELRAAVVPVNPQALPPDHPEHALFQALLATPINDATIAPLRPADLDVVLLSDADIRQLSSGLEGQASFYARFPGSHGVTTLSGIGFDPLRERAMVVISIGAGTFVSSSIAYVLEKPEVEWRIANQYWLVFTIG